MLQQRHIMDTRGSQTGFKKKNVFKVNSELHVNRVKRDRTAAELIIVVCIDKTEPHCVLSRSFLECLVKGHLEATPAFNNILDKVCFCHKKQQFGLGSLLFEHHFAPVRKTSFVNKSSSRFVWVNSTICHFPSLFAMIWNSDSDSQLSIYIRPH